MFDKVRFPRFLRVDLLRLRSPRAVEFGMILQYFFNKVDRLVGRKGSSRRSFSQRHSFRACRPVRGYFQRRLDSADRWSRMLLLNETLCIPLISVVALTTCGSLK